MFTKQVGQLQKGYLCRCLVKGNGITVKDWVAQVLELNKYLKEFLMVDGVREATSQNPQLWRY